MTNLPRPDASLRYWYNEGKIAIAAVLSCPGNSHWSALPCMDHLAVFIPDNDCRCPLCVSSRACPANTTSKQTVSNYCIIIKWLVAILAISLKKEATTIID